MLHKTTCPERRFAVEPLAMNTNTIDASKLSLPTLHKLVALTKQRAKYDEKITKLLTAAGATNGTATATMGKQKEGLTRKKMSASARAKISAAAKLRWKSAKLAGKNTL